VLTSTINSDLMEIWNEADSEMRVRFHFPLHGGLGTESAAVVYFEVEPGEYFLGRRARARLRRAGSAHRAE